MRKPKVTLKCVADQYASPGEKIIELSDNGSGCLISIRRVNGKLVICPYRGDKDVVVWIEGREIQVTE
jgi:hypothetical protein